MGRADRDVHRSAGGRRRRRRHGRSATRRAARALTLLVVLVLAVAGAVAVRDVVGQEASATVVRIDDDTMTVIAQERFALSGRLSPRLARPVVLEHRLGDDWVRVSRAMSRPDGTFVIDDVSVGSGAALRLSVPATTIGPATHAAARRPLPRVRVVPQQVAPIALVPGVVQPGALPAPAADARIAGSTRFIPARPGRPVDVQWRRDRGVWETLSTTTQDRHGEVRFEAPPPLEPGVQYRLRARPQAGAGGFASPGADVDDWSLVFDDEFSLGYLDPATWIIRGDEHAPESRRTCARADASMATVAEGVLRLTAAPDPSRASDVCRWRDEANGDRGRADWMLNGHVATEGQFSFRYGVAAARVRFQKPRGMHGSFWLQDSAEDHGTRAAEIDTVEFFGKGYSQGGLASFVHLPTGEKYGGLQPRADEALMGPADAWWRRYHVFSVEWTPREYVFRVDGQEIFRTRQGVADRKVFVILSLLTSDWELKKLPPGKTGQVDVDWVRVWQDTRLASDNL